mgnify:CR=1 FL=1
MRRCVTLVLTILLVVVWLPVRAHAAPSVGLVKASGPAVYYYAENGKRYVFPNDKIYFTWYSDFSTVQTISDAELAALPLGGNVTYRPGVKLVKIQTDPKVYAVDAKGTLRWITSEAVAASLYASNWSRQVDDLSDAYFVNYKTGAPIDRALDFNPGQVQSAASSISVDLGLEQKLSFTIEGDDQGLYPSTLTVPRAATISLTLSTRSTGVYYGGLEYRTSLLPGGSLTAAPGVAFTVNNIVTPATPGLIPISSYWPSSNVLKATGTIVVQ